MTYHATCLSQAAKYAENTRHTTTMCSSQAALALVCLFIINKIYDQCSCRFIAGVNSTLIYYQAITLKVEKIMRKLKFSINKLLKLDKETKDYIFLVL